MFSLQFNFTIFIHSVTHSFNKYLHYVPSTVPSGGHTRSRRETAQDVKEMVMWIIGPAITAGKENTQPMGTPKIQGNNKFQNRKRTFHLKRTFYTHPRL